MVGYTKKYENFSSTDYVLAGASSGFITRALCQPLDVLKIRFQLQVEPIDRLAASKYQSLFQALRIILREEGVKALWKGHVPAQWLSIIYGMVQFSTYEYLDKQVHLLEVNNPRYSYFLNFACGTVSGCAATVISFPFDVTRTRLVAQSEQKMIYKGTIHSWQNILQKERPLTLFRGLLPTFLQVGPHAGAQFACYKLFNDLHKIVFKNEETTFSSSFVSGSLAGLCAKTAIYPFDLVKKRMQIQGFEEGRKIFGKLFYCKGMLDALKRIYLGEGASGFFKGLSPSLVKAVVTTGMYFSTYEMSCELINDLK
ncbi:unnamed protein product [Psylliodes chrysocephalus]|uniref:Mitochondrial thiamine pyrophosphate carrier n=1 Tax=Psylliodes chrysocephalus TaxID=3402493 RepID=A0A9P0GAE0_9CUCU|nr:unnamed protein product [Psylliodes chrysocephala]